MRTRVRNLPGLNEYQACLELWRRTAFPLPKGKPYLVGKAVPWGTWHATPNTICREVTSDENHKIRSLRSLRGASGDLGGTFDSVKAGRRSNAPTQTIATNYAQEDQSGWTDIAYRYIGPVFAINPDLVAVDLSGSLRRNLKPLGTTAIARCKPTNHVSDLAVDMFETYQSGLPKLPGIHTWEKRTLGLKSIGSEYLNSEFGWKPLVSDIRNASYAAANSDRLMKAYEENSGKPVRRSYVFQ